MITTLSYVALFAQSNALELPVYAWGYRRALGAPKALGLATLSNMVTHPIVFFGFLSLGWSQLAAVLAAETFAVVGEAFLHAGFGRVLRLRSTLTWSLLANLVSWQLAPVLTWAWVT